MHKHQKLQDLLIKFPAEHAHREGQVRSLVLQTNYNSCVSSGNSSSLLLVIYQYYLWTGAWPQICQAKRSVASFKLRKGMDIGVKQTITPGAGKVENFLKIFLLNMVNLPSSSEENQSKLIQLSQTGQANLGLSNIENLRTFYQDKEEGQHRLLSSYPTFGVNITINLPSHKKGDKIQRVRNAMILSQHLLPVKAPRFKN